MPTLIRTLAATTALMLSGDSSFVGATATTARVRVLEQLWLTRCGAAAARSVGTAGIVTAMAHG